MAEEQRLEGHRLCANNCGFFGTPATRNLCSKCYRDFHLSEDQDSAVKIAVEKSLCAVSVTAPSANVGAPLTELVKAGKGALTRSPAASRCSACSKRVGLTGFVCKCGGTFCGAHRYPEKHTCGHDFKAEGKQAIARANPVVRAEKLEKI